MVQGKPSDFTTKAGQY